ncbi:MAG TPA: NAD-dependent epimerase/dehydratase family protein [Candidatus Polarisedimenticolaceae bacterium]
MRSVLVTGAAGFIGSHVVERLLGRGDRVVGLDSFDDFYDPSLKERNVGGVLGHPDYRLVRGDIRDDDALHAAFAGERHDAVFHMAARAGVRPSIEDPVLYASVNLDGTAKVLEAARRHGVRTFVFGSSSSVYGNNAKVPFAEDDPVDHPISPYAATKRAGELMAHTYHHLFAMDVACLRFFTVYGPRQRPDLAIRKFARRIAAGETIPQFGDGSAARDYTYVDDIVDGVLLAAERVRGFRIWNLGGSSPVPLSAMIAAVATGLGASARVEVLPAQAGDVERTWADVSRARSELGWSPRVGFDEGISRFLDWFRSTP